MFPNPNQMQTPPQPSGGIPGAPPPSMVEPLADAGVKGDTEMAMIGGSPAHVTKGEIVVTNNVLDTNPVLRQILQEAFQKAGMDIERYTVQDTGGQQMQDMSAPGMGAPMDPAMGPGMAGPMDAGPAIPQSPELPPPGGMTASPLDQFNPSIGGVPKAAAAIGDSPGMAMPGGAGPMMDPSRKNPATGASMFADMGGFQPPTLDPGGNPIDLSRPMLNNNDGTFSTERSITITDPRVNGGQATNIPSIWQGQELDQQQAIEKALASGQSFPGFGSIDEAITAAKARSAEIGRIRGPQAESQFTGGMEPQPAMDDNMDWMMGGDSPGNQGAPAPDNVHTGYDQFYGAAGGDDQGGGGMGGSGSAAGGQGAGGGTSSGDPNEVDEGDDMSGFGSMPQDDINEVVDQAHGFTEMSKGHQALARDIASVPVGKTKAEREREVEKDLDARVANNPTANQLARNAKTEKGFQTENPTMTSFVKATRMLGFPGTLSAISEHAPGVFSGFNDIAESVANSEFGRGFSDAFDTAGQAVGRGFGMDGTQDIGDPTTGNPDSPNDDTAGNDGSGENDNGTNVTASTSEPEDGESETSPKTYELATGGSLTAGGGTPQEAIQAFLGGMSGAEGQMPDLFARIYQQRQAQPEPDRANQYDAALQAHLVRQHLARQAQSEPDRANQYDAALQAHLVRQHLAQRDPRINRTTGLHHFADDTNFDAAYYRENNPTVAAAIDRGDFANEREHYDRHGQGEERRGYEGEVTRADFRTDTGEEDSRLLGGNHTSWADTPIETLQARQEGVQRGFAGGDAWGNTRYANYLDHYSDQDNDPNTAFTASNESNINRRGEDASQTRDALREIDYEGAWGGGGATGFLNNALQERDLESSGNTLADAYRVRDYVAPQPQQQAPEPQITRENFLEFLPAWLRNNPYLRGGGVLQTGTNGGLMANAPAQSQAFQPGTRGMTPPPRISRFAGNRGRNRPSSSFYG